MEHDEILVHEDFCLYWEDSADRRVKRSSSADSKVEKK